MVWSVFQVLGSTVDTFRASLALVNDALQVCEGRAAPGGELTGPYLQENS